MDKNSSMSVSFLAILDGVLARGSAVLNDSITNIAGSSKSSDKRLLVGLEEPLDEGLYDLLVGM
jgi:hypothetical protein